MKRRLEWLYILLALAFIAGGRWDSMLYPLPLNPDEVQAAANTLRIKAYGISWDAVDGNTVGPLNSLILCWPYLLGGDVTLGAVRLTASVLLGVIFVFTYFSLRTAASPPFAVLLSLPLAVFYSLTRTPDFLHYSSELLSLSLLLFSLHGTLEMMAERKGRGLRPVRLVLLGLAVGAVPFAKLQAAPIALCIGVCALWLLRRVPGKDRTAPLLALLAGAVLPAFALLAPLLASGKIHHFYNSYIAWGLAYIKEPLSAADLYALIASDPALKALLAYSAVIGMASLATLGPFMRRARPALLIAAYAAVLVGVALFAVVRPGNAFPHYLMLLPPFALVLAGALGNAGFLSGLQRAIHGGIGIVALGFLVAPVFIAGIQDEAFHVYAYKTGGKGAFHWRHPDLFAWLSPVPADRLLVWGRMPQWYVWTGLAPATRESITYNQTVDSRLAAYFRGRLLDDFIGAKPDFVIDAAAGKTFNPDDVETHGISSFPELAALVEGEYVRMGPAERRDSACPALFVRRERAARLERQLVAFRSISASAEKSARYGAAHVDDWSVTEDACIDFWLPPNGKPGSVRLEFTAEERIRKLLILNTHEGAAFYRGTGRIIYALYNRGSRVASRELKLRRHPEWTSEVFDPPVTADALAIEILSFEDNGGGLNEIKVIRDLP